ncbi:hypothetical protein RchiOBHm_Chr3g0494921 [Rosa chinensis]|uniref:Uncharacterized protein n=1 Tax=Rosa chinensis TaxID=74649 RepID=A0A2P6RH40_ROSCH|nr:hypothetical protein RchiOBHm_Chr3g0494921 [Rosa chinensis]
MNSKNSVAKQLGLDVDPNLNHSFPSMVTRNRTLLYRKYKDALKTVCSLVSSSASASTSSSVCGSVIKLSLLMHKNRSYALLSTEDPGVLNWKCGMHGLLELTYIQFN